MRRRAIVDAIEWVSYTLLAFAVLAGCVTLLDDMRKRDSLTGEVSLVFDERNTGKSALTVHVAGVVNDAQESSKQQSEIWLEYTDVLYLRFSGDRFKVEQGITLLLNYLRSNHGYQHVIFNLSSLGGLVGYDVVTQLPNAPFAISMITADSASTRAKLYTAPQLALRLNQLLPVGARWNNASELFMKYLVIPPKEENIEPGVDRAALELSVARTRSYKLSFYHDQGRYLYNHAGPKPGSLSHVQQFIYVRSVRDTDTVRPEAFEVWNLAMGGRAQLVESDTTHVGFAERPHTWQATFRMCYDKVMAK